MTYHLKNEERPPEFNKVGNKIDSNYLIYEFKTEEKCPKDFRDCQNPIELLKNLSVKKSN